AAARLLAVLELLLTRPPLEEAHECTEESEAWEEVDDRGEGGAVGEGRFRERDLLALLEALPLQDMIARILLFVRTKTYVLQWTSISCHDDDDDVDAFHGVFMKLTVSKEIPQRIRRSSRKSSRLLNSYLCN
ncbi:jg9414, partial [Pararge aegeria aegeria]